MNATHQANVDWLSEIAYDEDGRFTPEIREAIKCEGSGRGCSRNVWFCDDVAYKFLQPDTMHGNSNQIEWDVYSWVDVGVRDMMAECLAISPDSRVLAMERMGSTLMASEDVNGWEADEMLSQFNEELCIALSEMGLDDRTIDNMTHDNHDENVAFNAKMQLRWIDYGTDRGERSW